jgi:hypothetical protein
MIPVLTVSQMRAIDEASIGNDLNAGYSYMLKAGMGLFLAIKEIVPPARSPWYAEKETTAVTGMWSPGCSWKRDTR